MGKVYAAEDSRLNRRIALKILSPEIASQPRSVARFFREARSGAALNHPNIVTVYSVEEEAGFCFLTMELIEGETLARSIPEKGMPTERLLEIAVPLCEALDAAHQKGIVHRDLKPRNVMVSREGRIKVLDFGIAKPLADGDVTLVEGQPPTELTQPGNVVGTTRYMSPEQILGRPVDHRTDLFSLGVVLYEISTGRLPFTGEAPTEIMTAILRDTPPPASSLNPQIPRRLDAIIARCLAKDPADRYQTALEIRRDLQGLSASVWSSSGLTAFRNRGAVHRRSLAMAVIALVLLTVGGSGALLLFSGRLGPFVRQSFTLAAEDAQPSLAVLPLGNLSGDPEYFVDGMTDALIAALAKIRGVRVISRQSVMRYKGSDKSLPEIARELGVGLVIEGSVLRAGDRVRITAQLVSVSPEQQMWAETYEGEMRNVLALQGEVAKAVAREIQVELTAQENARLTPGTPVDPEVYESYLQGRYFWNKRDAEGLRRAIGFFNKALEKDPTYAPAYAGLADTYSLLSYRFGSPDESFPKAKAAALKALELDATLAEAHASLAYVLFYHERDWQAADRAFLRAIELDPSYSTARHWYWGFLWINGRPEEAAQEIRLAWQLDPLSLIINANLGRQDYLTGRYDAAIEQYRKTLAMDPGFPTVHLYLWRALEKRGRAHESFQALTRYLEIEGYGQAAVAAEQAYKDSGYRSGLAKAAAELEKIARQRPVSSSLLAEIYTVLRDGDQAIARLAMAYRQRSPSLLWLHCNPDWDEIRSDARIQEIARRLNLPQPAAGLNAKARGGPA